MPSPQHSVAVDVAVDVAVAVAVAERGKERGVEPCLIGIIVEVAKKLKKVFD